MSFKSTLVTGRDPRALVRDACAGLAPLPAGANLGVVYASDQLAGDLEGILEGLKLATGIESWIGGVALGVCSDAGERFDTPAVAVMVAAFPGDAFHVFRAGNGTAAERQRQAWMQDHAPCLAVVHGDPRAAEVERQVSDLGQSAFVVGGLLSSRSRYLHVANITCETTVSGLLLAPEVAVASGLSQGCQAVGPRRTVTRADGQLLLELDDRAAIEMLREDLAGAGNGTGSGGLHVAISVPGDDGRNFLVRNLMGLIPDQGAVVVGDRLQTGQSVTFCRRDAPGASSDLRQMLASLARRLPGPARGALYVSCLARGPNLFPEANLETGLIREAFPGLPFVGFFANGEFSRDRIYAYTGVLTLFC